MDLVMIYILLFIYKHIIANRNIINLIKNYNGNMVVNIIIDHNMVTGLLQLKCTSLFFV